VPRLAILGDQPLVVVLAIGSVFLLRLFWGVLGQGVALFYERFED
jgi:cytochrome b